MSATDRPEMDLPSERNPCRNCGRWGHEHDKEKVFIDGGAWHWEYYCSDTPTDAAGMRARLSERVGASVDQLMMEYRRQLPLGGES